jgi:hypothetical protein
VPGRYVDEYVVVLCAGTGHAGLSMSPSTASECRSRSKRSTGRRFQVRNRQHRSVLRRASDGIRPRPARRSRVGADRRLRQVEQLDRGHGEGSHDAAA